MVIKEDFKEDLQERKLSSIENEIDNESKVIKTDFKFKNEKSDKWKAKDFHKKKLNSLEEENNDKYKVIKEITDSHIKG